VSIVTLSLPADRIDWQTLKRAGHSSCYQTAELYQGDKLVCKVTVQWPAALPSVPVVCSTTDGRHAGTRD